MPIVAATIEDIKKLYQTNLCGLVGVLECNFNDKMQRFIFPLCYVNIDCLLHVCLPMSIIFLISQVRAGCNFLCRVCQDEYQLYFHFFNIEAKELK